MATASAASRARSPAPSARAASAALSKLKVCGPKITGRPTAQGSMRFCPP